MKNADCQETDTKNFDEQVVEIVETGKSILGEELWDQVISAAEVTQNCHYEYLATVTSTDVQ